MTAFRLYLSLMAPIGLVAAIDGAAKAWLPTLSAAEFVTPVERSILRLYGVLVRVNVFMPVLLVVGLPVLTGIAAWVLRSKRSRFVGRSELVVWIVVLGVSIVWFLVALQFHWATLMIAVSSCAAGQAVLTGLAYRAQAELQEIRGPLLTPRGLLVAAIGLQSVLLLSPMPALAAVVPALAAALAVMLQFRVRSYRLAVEQ